MKVALLALAAFITLESHAQTHVRGYFRSNGTYVQPHIRSAPDSSKWNNYGSSSSSSFHLPGSYSSPSFRDSDKDGISNQYDSDDDNDGVMDDQE